MSIEIAGWLAPRVTSEIIPPSGPAWDSATIERTARIHEEAGFDTVLVGWFSDAPDGLLVAAQGAQVTERLRFLVAHRPGFTAPTVAARSLATLDQLTGGRTKVHLISGGSDADQARDGDHVDHAGRYRRTAEYASVLRAVWTSDVPVDHEGEFYRIAGARSQVRCAQEPHLPIYGGGGSEAAIAALAPHVETFMLWGEPLAETRAFMERVRAAAEPHGRTPRFSVSTRPILGATEAAAWERAHDILERIQASHGGRTPARPDNIASRRLLDAAARSDRFDRCLWTPLATASGAPGNSTALVGTPETVAEALLDYVDLGVDTLLIRGYDPLLDAEDYGRELIPRVRELVAARDRTVRRSA
ncbi:MAG: LLM class flavin-dependent oxidoreductase [Actinobacteria bacterium]|nr:LLM class flavin-dependent oxidoreductase [Actinomycetota bacterium]